MVQKYNWRGVVDASKNVGNMTQTQRVSSFSNIIYCYFTHPQTHTHTNTLKIGLCIIWRRATVSVAGNIKPAAEHTMNF